MLGRDRWSCVDLYLARFDCGARRGLWTPRSQIRVRLEESKGCDSSMQCALYFHIRRESNARKVY
jgi:hypothetical protein